MIDILNSKSSDEEIYDYFNDLLNQKPLNEILSILAAVMYDRDKKGTLNV